jgi:hypothetical protein
MSGTVTPFVDYKNTADTGENAATSIQPITNGEQINQTLLQRPDENLRQRTEVLRSFATDSLFLANADRKLLLAGPGAVTWPGSTTAAASGRPVLSDVLWLIPMLTPGAAQAQPIPPVASAYGTLHLKRSSDSANSILVTSQRRSYAAGDQINIQVSAGSSFSCTLQAEVTGAYRRTIKIVAAPATTLGTVITALNGLLPPSPDNTQLVTAALEGGASNGDIILDTQARQFVAGNYDGEGHTITPANLASFFTSNPTESLAEGDTLCVQFTMLSDTASTGGRRQAIPENSNTTITAGMFFNSRVHPEKLVNALPICKVVNGSLVFSTGIEIPAGSTAAPLSPRGASTMPYGGGGTWADGTTNPATTVEAQLDKVITDLAGATGTAKIFGAAAGSGDLASGTLESQIAALVTGWGKLGRANSWTALQTFANALAAGSGLLSTAANARSARISTPFSATHPITLIWQSTPDSGSLPVSRIYVTSAGLLYISMNASYDGTNWNKDVAGTQATLWKMSNGILETYGRVADAAWATAAWTQMSKRSVAQTVTAANPNFAPLLEHFDSANNRRVAADHMGFPGAYRAEIRQNWLLSAVADTGDGWTRFVSGTGAISGSNTTLRGLPAVDVSIGNGAGQVLANLTRGTAFSALGGTGCPPPNMSVMMEWVFDATTIVGASPGATFTAGMRNSSPGLFFRKIDGQANWQFCTQGISTALPVDTGVACSSEQLFRIELYGSNHPGGQRALAFINGALVAEVTLTAASLDYPDMGLGPAFELVRTGATTTIGGRLGPAVIQVRQLLADFAV